MAGRLFRALFLMVLSISLWACSDMPEPEEFRVEFGEVRAEVASTGVTLIAKVDVPASAVYKCGFLYASSDIASTSDMIATSSKMGASSTFTSKIADLMPGCEYIYKAYLTNGRNTLYSDEYRFETAALPQTPDDPQAPDTPLTPDNPEKPDVPETPDPEVPEVLRLSSYITYVDGDDTGYIYVTVACDREWEIVVPDDKPWVISARSENVMYLYPEPNPTKDERVCDVLVRTLDKGLSAIHRIVQGPTKWSSLKIDVSHQEQNYYVPLMPGWETSGYAPVNGWLKCWGEIDEYDLVDYHIAENNGLESRAEYIRVYAAAPGSNVTDEIYYVEVTQHSYLDLIEFKDPKAKELCVGLWDLSHDGELSFEEAAAVPGLDEGQFSGWDITSFEELRFFNHLSMPDYLFEGSTVESVVLPVGLQIPLGKGTFKDCRNLKAVDLGHRVVSEEAFMDCTSLETMLLSSISVPEKAFKGCVSLRAVTFDERYVSSSASIGAEAFYGCSSLSEIRLHRKVSSIGDRAFYGCSALSAIHLSSGIPPTLGEDVFVGTGPDFRICVPSSLVNVYKSSWPALADLIEAE